MPEFDIRVAKVTPNSLPGPDHERFTTVTIPDNTPMQNLKDKVLLKARGVDNRWEGNGVYVECIEVGGNSFFLEDKEKRRERNLSQVDRFVLWRKDTIDAEVKNITTQVTRKTGTVGSLVSAAQGDKFFRKFSEVTTGAADGATPFPVYFQHLLFARRALAQANESGIIPKPIRIGAGFLTNWMGLARSQI